MISTILLAAALSTSPTCLKLEKELASTEKYWGVIHGVNQRLRDINLQAHAEVPSRDTYENLQRSIRTIRDEDQEFERTTDRIVQIMLANKCTPPDHAPTWVSPETPTTSAEAPAISSGSSGIAIEPWVPTATLLQQIRRPAHP